MIIGRNSEHKSGSLKDYRFIEFNGCSSLERSIIDLNNNCYTTIMSTLSFLDISHCGS